MERIKRFMKLDKYKRQGAIERIRKRKSKREIDR